MCPMCIATVAHVIAGATSTGGLAALVMKRGRPEIDAKNINPTAHSNGGPDESPENRVAN